MSIASLARIMAFKSTYALKKTQNDKEEDKKSVKKHRRINSGPDTVARNWSKIKGINQPYLLTSNDSNVKLDLSKSPTMKDDKSSVVRRILSGGIGVYDEHTVETIDSSSSSSDIEIVPEVSNEINADTIIDIPRNWSESDIHSSAVKASFAEPDNLAIAKNFWTDRLSSSLRKDQENSVSGMWPLESPASIDNFQVPLPNEKELAETISTLPIDSSTENQSSLSSFATLPCESAENIQDFGSYMCLSGLDNIDSSSVGDDESVFRSVSTPNSLSLSEDVVISNELGANIQELVLNLSEENNKPDESKTTSCDEVLEESKNELLADESIAISCDGDGNETWSSAALPVESVQEDFNTSRNDNLGIFFGENESQDNSVQVIEPQEIKSDDETSPTSSNWLNELSCLYENILDFDSNDAYNSDSEAHGLSLIHPDLLPDENYEGSYEIFGHEPEQVLNETEITGAAYYPVAVTEGNKKDEDEYSIADFYAGDEIIPNVPEISDLSSFKIKIKSKSKKSKKFKSKSKLSSSDSSSSDSSSDSSSSDDSSSNSDSSSSTETSDSSSETDSSNSNSSSSSEDKTAKKTKFRSTSPSLPRRGPAERKDKKASKSGSNFKRNTGDESKSDFDLEIKMKTEIDSANKLENRLHVKTLEIGSEDNSSQIIIITSGVVISIILLLVLINKFWVKHSVGTGGNGSRLNT